MSDSAPPPLPLPPPLAAPPPAAVAAAAAASCPANRRSRDSSQQWPSLHGRGCAGGAGWREGRVQNLRRQRSARGGRCAGSHAAQCSGAGHTWRLLPAPPVHLEQDAPHTVGHQVAVLCHHCATREGGGHMFWCNAPRAAVGLCPIPTSQPASGGRTCGHAALMLGDGGQVGQLGVCLVGGHHILDAPLPAHKKTGVAAGRLVMGGQVRKQAGLPNGMRPTAQLPTAAAARGVRRPCCLSSAHRSLRMSSCAMSEVTEMQPMKACCASASRPCAACQTTCSTAET